MARHSGLSCKIVRIDGSISRTYEKLTSSIEHFRCFLAMLHRNMLAIRFFDPVIGKFDCAWKGSSVIVHPLKFDAGNPSYSHGEPAGDCWYYA